MAQGTFTCIQNIFPFFVLNVVLDIMQQNTLSYNSTLKEKNLRQAPLLFEGQALEPSCPLWSRPLDCRCN